MKRLLGGSPVLAPALALMLAAGLLLGAGGAEAHRFAPSLLKFFEVGEGRYQVVWKTPVQRTSDVPLLPVFPPHCAPADGDFGTGGTGTGGTGTSGGNGARGGIGTLGGAGTLEGTGVVSTLELACPGGLIGREVAVSGLLDNQASVLFSLETRDGFYYQSLLNAGQPSFNIPAEPTAVEVMREYLWLGVGHILGGIDHLLFVFGLLLLVGWGRNLVWTVTAFTLGHSVTLSLVTLGVFDYPVALVEFTIAMSIFVLAVELARPDGGGPFRKHPWWLAGSFGLLHGMGFAGALADVGLPQAEVPLALLFFNIGIELGQLAFIVTAVALWWTLRRALGGRLDNREAQLLPVPIYILGTLSMMWCIERALEIF